VACDDTEEVTTVSIPQVNKLAFVLTPGGKPDSLYAIDGSELSLVAVKMAEMATGKVLCNMALSGTDSILAGKDTLGLMNRSRDSNFAL